MILSLYSKRRIVSEFSSRLLFLVTSDTRAKIQYLYRLFPDQRALSSVNVTCPVLIKLIKVLTSFTKKFLVYEII